MGHYLNFGFDGNGFVYFLIMILISTCILPALSIYILYKYGLVQDLSLIIRRDRYAPNVVTTITYIITFCMLYFVNGMKPVVVLPLVFMSVTLVLHGLVSLFWKISAHATGVGGVLGFWSAMHYFVPVNTLFYPYLAFVFLTGAVFSSRLYLGRHTAAQVWAGGLMGFTVAVAGVCVFVFSDILKHL